MQISASTLLASQQVGQVQAKPALDFAQALEKGSGFQPLPLRQTASVENISAAVQPSAAKGPQKLGSAIDIKI
ncbi:MAG TPA: hypothetical protein VN718_04155 [Rhizomicrobium sp.]|nr:hypothetical protein [Rhizomicrobium sp.]